MRNPMATESESQRHVSFRKICKVCWNCHLHTRGSWEKYNGYLNPKSVPPRSGRCRVRVRGRDRFFLTSHDIFLYVCSICLVYCFSTVSHSCMVLNTELLPDLIGSYFHLNWSPARPSFLTRLFWWLDAGDAAFEEERPEEAVEQPPAREWQPDDVL